MGKIHPIWSPWLKCCDMCFYVVHICQYRSNYLGTFRGKNPLGLYVCQLYFVNFIQLLIMRNDLDFKILICVLQTGDLKSGLC
jgi:hypothetical protein